MELPIGEQRSIQIRGKVVDKHPCFDMCKAPLDGTAFRTLLGLAEEAVLVRARLTHMASAGHPLSASLSGMSSAEAVAYLLGVTEKYMQQSLLVPSDKGESNLSDKHTKRRTNNEVSQAEGPASPTNITDENSTESDGFDNEVLDSLINFSMAQS